MAFNLTNDNSLKDPKQHSVLGLTAFPNDLPNKEELRTWLPHLLSRIDALGLSAFIRGADPPYVLQYKTRDLTQLPELPSAAGEGTREARLALRASIVHENSIKEAMKKEWTRDQEQKVASLVLDSMRYSAVSRFERMQRDHAQLDDAGDAIPNAFNGISP